MGEDRLAHAVVAVVDARGFALVRPARVAGDAKGADVAPALECDGVDWRAAHDGA